MGNHLYTVYTTEGCEKCKSVIAALEKAGKSYSVRDAKSIMAGTSMDLEAMARIAEQNMALPAVQHGEEWLSLAEIDELTGE